VSFSETLVFSYKVTPCETRLDHILTFSIAGTTFLLFRAVLSSLDFVVLYTSHSLKTLPIISPINYMKLFNKKCDVHFFYSAFDICTFQLIFLCLSQLYKNKV